MNKWTEKKGLIGWCARWCEDHKTLAEIIRFVITGGIATVMLQGLYYIYSIQVCIQTSSMYFTVAEVQAMLQQWSVLGLDFVSVSLPTICFLYSLYLATKAIAKVQKV